MEVTADTEAVAAEVTEPVVAAAAVTLVVEVDLSAETVAEVVDTAVEVAAAVEVVAEGMGVEVVVVVEKEVAAVVEDTVIRRIEVDELVRVSVVIVFLKRLIEFCVFVVVNFRWRWIWWR